MLHLANIAALGHWLSALVIVLVATAGGIGCISGLAANGQPHWLRVTYNSIFGLEIKCFLHYAEPMQLMWPCHSRYTSVMRQGKAKQGELLQVVASLT